MLDKYNENSYELSVIDLLKNSGYTYLSSKEMQEERLGADNYFSLKTYILKNKLINSIKKINPDIEKHHIDLMIKSVFDCFSTTNLLESNKCATSYLQNGIKIYDNKIKKTLSFRLIDFDNPNNNEFIVTNQFECINDDDDSRRPDIVIYLNGLPISVMELKTPNKNINLINDKLIDKAFNQISNYKRQLKDLFVFNFFNVISDMNETKMGGTFSDIDRFTYWRLMNLKMSDYENNSIDTFINNVFNKKILLDLLKNFTFFTEEKSSKKIIAAYHQYYGVKDSLKSITEAIDNKTKKGGIFWHTQGTGKSLSMVFLTKNFTNIFKKSTVMIISDRNDLDDQTYLTFRKSVIYLHQEPTKINSIIDLKEKLDSVKQNGIYFSTIQKFQENKINLLSNREDFLIISDEAHRSHNNLNVKTILNEDENKIGNEDGTIDKKGYALILREAFPNATFTGFTGTPIVKDDFSTTDIFGSVITKYPMWLAIKDKFIVPINYEVRHKHLKLAKKSAEKIDKHYELLISEVEESSKIKNISKKKMNKEIQNLEKIILHQERVEEIARDFVNHYNLRKNILKGKAIFVAYNRKSGFNYYSAIVKIAPELKDNIRLIATSNSSDSEEMNMLISSKKYQKESAIEFKDPDSNFKIAIVIDMWLTGFDVPSLDTIYIDKPIKMHNLMQAIARVNRVYSEQLKKEDIKDPKIKESGLVVDYFGISQHLQKALLFYNDEDSKMETKCVDISLIKEYFDNFIKNIYEKYFSNSDYNKIILLTDKVRFLTSELIKSNKESEFINDFRKIKKNIPAIIHIMNEIERKELNLLHFIYNHLVNFEIRNIKEYFSVKIDLLKEMIANSIEYNGSSEIDEFKNGKKISLEDLLRIAKNQKFEEQTKHLDAKEKETYIKLLISEISKVDKVRSEQISKKLEILLGKYESKFITFEEFILGFEEMYNYIEVGNQISEDMNLSDDELLFYYIIQPDSEDVVKKSDRETAIKIAREVYNSFANTINLNSKLKWYENENNINKIRVAIKDIMEKENFPPNDRTVAADRYINTIINRRISRG